MIISPAARLTLLILNGILPVWTAFFLTSTDYTFRGMMIPILASTSAAISIVIARTKSPAVDGEQPTVKDPQAVATTTTTTAIAKP